MRSVRMTLAACSVFALTTCAAACTLYKFGTREAPSDAGADASSPPGDAAPMPADAGAEASGSDACASGLMCNGQCSASVSCRACEAGVLECFSGSNGSNSCTSDCVKGCSADPVACFECGLAGGIGICQPQTGAYCLTVSYPHCPCGHDAGACPIPTHVCVLIGDSGAGECRTCGEDGTDHQPCQGGKKCVQRGQPPACTE